MDRPVRAEAKATMFSCPDSMNFVVERSRAADYKTKRGTRVFVSVRRGLA
jgi:hypothetical protein